jgi:hypothetical protein
MRWLLLSLALLSAPAFADEGPMVLVDSALCPNAAEYRPGVDVNGKAVTPADLEDSDDYGAGFAEAMTITLKVDLAKRLGIPSGGTTPEAEVGTLTRAKNGDLLLNGKKLGRPSAADLKALCAQASAP